MSDMTFGESWERFNESLKRAGSCCRELSVMQNYPVWLEISESLEGLRAKGSKMAREKQISKAELDRQIGQWNRQTAIANGEVLNG